jgi:hypothetical protein
MSRKLTTWDKASAASDKLFKEFPFLRVLAEANSLRYVICCAYCMGHRAGKRSKKNG